jgi:hypothetical protein
MMTIRSIVFLWIRTSVRLLGYGGVLMLVFASSAHGSPLGEPGTTFVYSLDSDLSARPSEAVKNGSIVTSAEFSIRAVVQGIDKPRQWFGITFTRQNGQKYTALLLMDRWPDTDTIPDVARYLWHEPNWEDYLEYVHEVTRKPILPRLSIWHYGWPQTQQKHPARFSSPLERLYLHGWPFKLVETRKEQLMIPEQVTRLELNPDLLIATTGVHRDLEGRHSDYLGGEYRYVEPMNEDDWRKDIDAGFNFFFRGGANQVGPWIWRTKCYVAETYVMPHGWPAQLYRSNYYGRVSYVDEPAIHIRGTFNTPDMKRSADTLTPQMVVKEMQRQIAQTLSETEFPRNNYGNRVLGVWVDNIFGKGNLDIVETDVASWEAIWQTAWYQLAVDGIGTAGMYDEWIYPEQLVERYNMAFGTQIPTTVENACAIRVAIGRGAGRNFNKRWGTALYAPTKTQLAEPKLNLTAFRYLYNAGATYMGHWFGWPGVSDSVVPYAYARASASIIRQCFRENPNRDLDALMHAAKVCIAIPDGYTFTHGPMFGIKALHLDRKNSSGVSYRYVLRNATLEMERLIRLGVKFDIVVDEPRFNPAGYEEIIRCKEDGSIIVSRRGKPQVTLTGPRECQRPDLGPMPSLKVQIEHKPVTAPGTVTLKAEALPSTGELRESPFYPGRKFIHWEIITPEGISSYDLSPNPAYEGETCTFEAKVPGVYRIRTATVDCFGRPCIVETEVTVARNANDISSFDPAWAFCKDPNHSGERENWFAINFNDSTWPRIPVPAAWENAREVGNYDGFGWYRTYFSIPLSAKGKKLLLRFEGADEEAWVYLNGKLIGQRTCTSTGKRIDEIWDQPFEIKIPPELIREDEKNVLAVKIHDSEGAGGLFEPVRLIIMP